ncbi:MAG: electron transfer flavoprotein subunit alpha/FixB family protein [Syntrophomonadaceae bacterium]|nr:electron transfer flavoprotein subunit alpha/FixB family protein [Syntrophomonadaceae bacterium]
MAGILVYSEKESLALELLSAARIIAGSLGKEIKAVTINDNEQANALSQAGASVYNITSQAINSSDPAVLASCLKEAVTRLGIDIVLLSSNRKGKELAGRIAQAIDAGCLTDVSTIGVSEGRIECQRNALGGATVATQYIASGRQVIAIRPKSFEPASQAPGTVNQLDIQLKASKLKVLETKPKRGDSIDIESVDILVAVGQGLKEQTDLAMVNDLAQKLGGEVACSKPLATDKKWFSEERVIGLSGKKCKPGLAVLLGISGQVQFTVGIRDARIIVSVNEDQNAPINYMSDYILTGDLYKIVPELNRLL